MRATMSGRAHSVSVAATALIFMALGLHPLVAVVSAVGLLTAAAVAGLVVSRRLHPDSDLTAMLADATETYGAFTVITAVIGLCVWLALRLNLRVDLSVIFGVIVAFPLTSAFLRWVLPLLPGFDRREDR